MVGFDCKVKIHMNDFSIFTDIVCFNNFATPVSDFVSLLVTVWYLLNEALSITENAGRMGAPVPEWLSKYIAVLKNKIDSKGDDNNNQK